MKYPVISLGTEWGGVDFNFLAIALHSHPKGDESPCPMRFGIRLTILGFNATVGIWDSSILENMMEL